MKNRTFSISITVFTAAIALLGACSSDSSGGGSSSSSSSSSSSGSSGAAAPACSDVCSSLADKCGSLPPGCDDYCSSLADSARSCIVAASSCEAANQCGSTSSSSSGGSSSGASGGDDPCKSCTAKQFCVVSSSVSSEVGCFDPPDSCNGSTTSICPCLYTDGPCSKGTKSCSEGLANHVTCN